MPTRTVTLPIFVNPSSADSLPMQYARVSVPFAKGIFKNLPAVHLADDRGRAVPAQADLLTRWPDKSVRVLHLTFQARGGIYKATFGDKAAPTVKNGITIQRKGDAVTVTNGRLTAKLGSAGIVESIRLGAIEMIGARGIDMRVIDGTKRAFLASAASKVETTVELEGPLRSIVALRGKSALGSETFIDFRLRFEFLAGVEGFSLLYSFFNLERGQDFFDVNAIELDLNLAGAAAPQHTVYQQSYGLFSTLGRMVTTPETFNIAVDDTKALAYVLNYDALGDEHDYPFYLNPPADKVDNWAVVADGKRALQVEMDDFHLLRPKTLDVQGNQARYGVWPARAGKLELQQGRSRQVAVRVALSDKGVPATQQDAIARTEQLRDLFRAQLQQKTYAQADFFDQGRVMPYNAAQHPRIENWFAAMSNLHTYALFFDIGDTPDSGYQMTYIPIGNRIQRVRSEDGGKRYFLTSLHYPAGPLNNLPDFEPVWVNNEYDVIFCLGTEYLRTNNLTLFQKLCWFSRHCIDVDFLHYSDHRWLNRAQPAHSERHTMTGAYPSHFWSQGLAQYYMLTGDIDALEVIVALADKTIENLDDPIMKEICSGLNREIGWGILTMICAYEASGIKRFDTYARELLDREINYGLPDDLPHFSFGHTSILLGARQYVEIHKGEKVVEPVRQWLLDFVDLAIRSQQSLPELDDLKKQDETKYSYDAEMAAMGKLFKSKPRSNIHSPFSMALDSFAYAYEITGDEKYIQAGLRTVESFVDSSEFRTPRLEGKPFAMIYRTFANFFKPAGELGYLKEFEYRY